MKIVCLKEENVPIGNGIIKQGEISLIVEMTQEEYQKCCACLFKDQL